MRTRALRRQAVWTNGVGCDGHRAACLLRGGAPMKMHILPPARAKIGNSTRMMPPSQDGLFVTAWGVVHHVAASYRYRRSIASEVQRDMLRFASLKGWGVCVGVS